jgi:hypothetical protein
VSGPLTGPTGAGDASDRRKQAERSRRRARIFGEVLPEATTDDQPDDPRKDAGLDAAEARLRREVPPHHG